MGEQGMDSAMGEVSSPEHGGPDQTGDGELIARVRTGDTAAFGQLFERHRDVALSVARRNSDSATDAEDAVSEAFSSIFQALSVGIGPDSFFRAYLLSAVTRIARHRNVHAGRSGLTSETEILDQATHDADPVLLEFESNTVSHAFSTLPERWQAVLWYLDVERMKPATAATYLGLSPNAVSALAIRARDGLRKAYLQSHVSVTVQDDCAPFASKLGSFAMNTLRRAERRSVQEHLDNCAKCTAVLVELNDVSSAMRAGLIPVVLGAGALGWFGLAPAGGVVASAGLLGWLQGLARAIFEWFQQLGRTTLAIAGAAVVVVAVAVVAVASQGFGLWLPPPTVQAEPAVSASNGPQGQPTAETSPLAPPPPTEVGETPSPLPPVAVPSPLPVPSPTVPTPARNDPTPAATPSPTASPTVPPTQAAQLLVSASASARPPSSAPLLRVNFNVSGTTMLEPATVTLRLKGDSSLAFGLWDHQPAGWQCEVVDNATMRCESKAPDRADLSFKIYAVVSQTAASAVLNYEYSSSQTRSFSADYVLR